jgi:hypothetical protein
LWIFAAVFWTCLSAVQDASAVTQPPSKYDPYLKAVVVVRSSIGEGAGFFVTPDGLLVTNHHVVGNDTAVTIILRDERQVTGKVLSVNGDMDLALVSIPLKTPDHLRFAKPNEGGIGSDVIAIGTAKGLSWSVSKGIVSGLRNGADFGIGGGENVLLVQTDAAINQGNSGGPLILVDTGTVIGVNTISFKKDIAEGISFAIYAENVETAFAGRLQPQETVKLDRELTQRDLAKENIRSWLSMLKNDPQTEQPPITIDNAETFGGINDSEGQLLIVTGRVTNREKAPHSFIRLIGRLHDEQGRELARKMVYCGNLLTDGELKTLTLVEIDKRLNVRSGLRGANENLPPGHSVTFMVVFGRAPENASEWSVEVFSSE